MLTQIQLKGLGIQTVQQQNPLIWNSKMANQFKSVTKKNLQFQDCDDDTFLKFKQKSKNRYEKIKKIRIFHVLKNKSIPSQNFLKKLFNLLNTYFDLEVQYDEDKQFTITQQLKLRDQDGIYQYDIPHRNKEFKAVSMLMALLNYKKQNEIIVGLIDYGLHEGKNTISGRAIGNGATIIDVSSWKSKAGKLQILSTTVHEIMHTLGLGHCNYWKCLMNPLTNDQILMCPVCLKKFHFHIKFNIKQRYQKLVNVLKDADFIHGSNKCKRILQSFNTK